MGWMRILVIFTLLFLVLSSNVSAQESTPEASSLRPIGQGGNDIGASTIYPGSIFYPLKAVREMLELKLALVPKTKAVRYMEFATRRLREAKSLVGTAKEELIQSNMERYWYAYQKVVKFQPRDEELTILLNNNLTIHLEVIEGIYYQLTNAKAQTGVRTLVNRIVQSNDLKPETRIGGCLFLQKEASSSALNEVEQEVYKLRAQKCFKLL